MDTPILLMLQVKHVRDFSTLYTKKPHDKLISKMTTFVKKLFDTNPEKPYICCSDKDRSAYWSKIISKTNISFSCDELINSIDFIVNNSFITFHSLVCRQVIGIPMGTNCAPFLANVFLHVYEYEYLQKLVTSRLFAFPVKKGDKKLKNVKSTKSRAGA